MTTIDDLDDLELDESVPEPGVTIIGVRCQPALMAAVDEWIGRQKQRPFISRPEAVRRLAVRGLKAGEAK
jgi:hypothetical protein